MEPESFAGLTVLNAETCLKQFKNKISKIELMPTGSGGSVKWKNKKSKKKRSD